MRLASEERGFLKRLDMNLILVVLCLNLIGLINLYSATHGSATTVHMRLFWQQFVWLGLGWGVYFFMTLMDFNYWKKLCWLFYAANILALLAVPFIGKSFYGAKRWLDLGFFKYQPSETMKLALVLVIASLLSHKSIRHRLRLKDLIFPGLLLAIPFLLIVKQPDLGTSLLTLMIPGSLLIIVQPKKSILTSAIILAIIAGPIAWKFGLKSYQKNRVLNFLSPERDPRGTGYNSIQSKIAVGGGQIFGKGFMKGTQSQLEFIPERHSDFIFSVLSEEHGMLGSLITLVIFFALFLIGFNIAANAPNIFGSLVAAGSISLIFWHMFVNIGMVIGIMPVVGVPLPLLSYGGSSLLTTMMALGLISSVSYRRNIF